MRFQSICYRVAKHCYPSVCSTGNTSYNVFLTSVGFGFGRIVMFRHCSWSCWGRVSHLVSHGAPLMFFNCSPLFRFLGSCRLTVRVSSLSVANYVCTILFGLSKPLVHIPYAHWCTFPRCVRLYDGILILCITTSPTKRFLEHSTSRTHSDTLSFHRFQTFFVTWGLLNVVPTSAQLYLQAAVLTFGLGHSLIFRSARPLGLFFCVSRCALCGDAIWQHFVASIHDRDHCWLAVCADHKRVLPHAVGDLLHSNRSTVRRRFPRHRNDLAQVSLFCRSDISEL